MVRKITFAQARRVMCTALASDSELRLSYVANVAMLLHDRHGIRTAPKRNSAAQDIVTLIFPQSRRATTVGIGGVGGRDHGHDYGRL